MELIFNGNAPSKLIYNGAEVSLYFNGSEIWPDIDYNPLNLPPNTIRVRTNDGNPPIKGSDTTYVTATLVDGTTDVYDVYKGGDFYGLFNGSRNVVEVLGANTTGITNMAYMFYDCMALTSVVLFDTSSVTLMGNMFYYCTALTSVPLFDTSSVTSMSLTFSQCTSLTSVPLFDTSSVTNMSNTFQNCRSLTAIPLFDTSNVTSMSQMFYDCVNIQTGALALYRQASTQPTPPWAHSKAFYNCGKNTTTGAAELAQIPSGWK